MLEVFDMVEGRTNIDTQRQALEFNAEELLVRLEKKTDNDISIKINEDHQVFTILWTNEMKNRKNFGKQAADIDRHKQDAATLLISFENQVNCQLSLKIGDKEKFQIVFLQFFKITADNDT